MQIVMFIVVHTNLSETEATHILNLSIFCLKLITVLENCKPSTYGILYRNRAKAAGE